MATDTVPAVPAAAHNVSGISKLRKDYTVADKGTTITVGTVPAGSVILKTASGVNVSTAFDGGSTVVDIGASDDSGTNNFGSAIVTDTADYLPLDVTGSYYCASETKIVAAITAASATVGVAQIVILFVENV